MFDIDALRADMPIVKQYNFMDHAAIGPISGRARAAMGRFLEEAADHAYVRGGLYPEAKRVRKLASKLVNCHPEELTFVKNTSEGICHVANGLQFSRADNIVTIATEFPANVYPWMNLQQHGVQLKMVPEDGGRVPVERIIEAIDDRTRVVAVSAVQYASGLRLDLAAIGQACQERGVLFSVDAIQALGCVPIDVKAMKIDFLSADGHKWLLAPEGAGIFYCRQEVLGLLRPTNVGWLSVDHPNDFDHYHLEFRNDARRFDGGSYNLLGIWGLGASLDWLLELQIDAIWNRVKTLTDRLVDGIRAKGYRIVSPRGPGESSGIVAFVSDTHDHARLVAHLRQEHRTVIAARRGRLRASPHFYNTEHEIDQLIDHLPGH